MRFGLIDEDGQWGIESITPRGRKAGKSGRGFKPFALLCSGYQTRGLAMETIHQIRCVGHEPGFSMRSVGPPRIVPGKELGFSYRDEGTGLEVAVTFKAAGAGRVVHASVTAANRGVAPVKVEHISPLFPGLADTGKGEWARNVHIHFARNSWNTEAQWHDRLICEEGVSDQGLSQNNTTAFQLHSTGSFSTGRFLPMAVLEDRAAGTCYFWEIRYSGSWFMEAGILGRRFYALASGPTKAEGLFWQTLGPGESLSSVAVAFGAARGGFDAAVAELTAYRRADLRPPCRADAKLPVIFNDYMHNIGADPTEDNELPVIEAAARAGAEYYLIDAGWYAERGKEWWHTVGEWRESPDRFPRGLAFLADRIRAEGMTPGLWVEIEVVGTDSPIADRLPEEWFFHRGGRRVIAASRYFLDFAHPAVREHCHVVVDRLVEDYGIGYLKIDYNVNHREGNETDFESAGAGQVAHVAGLYRWLDEVRGRHPELIIQSCSSGGGRLDNGLLAHAHLQSTTDQTDYLRMPSIATGTLAAALPEQLCQWAYPKGDASPENVAFCMVVAMLSRFDLSGAVQDLSRRGLALVQEAMAVYKGYRRDIPRMVPFFPCGMALIHRDDCFVVAGLRTQRNTLAYVTVFRLNSTSSRIEIPLPSFDMKKVRAAILYPGKMPGKVSKTARGIAVTLPRKRTARLIRIERR